MAERKKKTETALRGGAPEPAIIDPSADERLLEFQRAVEELKPSLDRLEKLMAPIKELQAAFKKFGSIYNSVRRSFSDVQDRLAKEDITEGDIEQIEKDFRKLAKDVQRLKELSESIGSMNQGLKL